MRSVMLVLILLGALVSAYCQETGEITQLKEMHLNTELVTDGQTKCLIAIPDEAEYARLGEKLAAAIEAACGVAPPVMPASQVSEEMLKSTNLIALGIFCLNEVTERLYLRELVLCDFSWPTGQDGYVIRTVHNPWLSGSNVIFIGGAHLAGCEAAVARFTELLSEARDGALGPLIEVSDAKMPARLDEAAIAAQEERIKGEGSSRSMGGIAVGHCNAYFRTGDPGQARLFLGAMRRLDELQAAEGAADDVRTCRYLFHEFDRIEEGPAFSDEDRLELTNIFYRFAQRLTYASREVKPSETPHGNNWNATGASYAGMYFARYYPDLEIGKKILDNLDVYYEPNMVNWKVNEDCPGYGNITLTGNYNWALHRPDPRYLENDSLRRMADYDMLITSNLGSVSGFGDASGLGRKYVVAAYPIAAWLYKDARYLWWWDHHGGGPGYCWVPPEVLPRERPDDLLGIARAPLAEWVYNRRNYEASREAPIEECYDKVSFRAGFEPDDQYLCMSGFGYGFHSHPDANCIVNYSDRGEAFLYDDGYMIPALSEHNTVTILKDGWAGHTPELAQVIAEADFEGAGIFRSRLDDYNGVRWDRCVIWPRGDYFLVVDDLRALEPADYNFQCIWRTLGAADLSGRRWTSDKGDSRFSLVACSDASLAQKDSAGTSLNARPFPLDQARRLVQAAGGQMELGDSYQFANLFYTTAAQDARQVEITRVDDTTTYLIEYGAGLAMAGIDRTSAIRGVDLEAQAFHLCDNVLHVAGATTVRVRGPLLSSNVAVDAQIDLATGTATVEAEEPVEVTYDGGEGQKVQALQPGRHTLKLRGTDVTSLRRVHQALQAEYARLAAAPEPQPQPIPGTGQGLSGLWEYSGFEAYRNFASVAGVKLRVNQVHMTPDQAGYPVGEPMDLLNKGGNVMFPDGKTVLIEVDLGQPRELARIVANSRQLRTFNGGCGVSKLTVSVSDDSFAADRRLVGAREITDPLQDAMVPYAIGPAQPVAGRYLRIEAVPYTDQHNVYLDSIELHGLAGKEELIASGFHLNALEVADLDGDGRHEVFAAGTDKTIHAIGPDGGGLWKRPTGDVVNDLAVADSTGAGDYRIVAACDDKTLYCASEDGSESWTLAPPPRTYARPGYRGVKPFQSRLTVAFASDLDGDNDDEVIVGSANWRTYVYDHEGELLWDEVLWAHTPTCGTACDLDGDGQKEVIMGNSYTSTKIYSSTGELLGSGRGSGHAGPTAVAAADFDGNGVGEMLVGDRAGKIWFQEWQGRDMPSWDTGSDVSALGVADIDGDGRIESAVASRNFLLYLFDADGQPLWQLNLLDVCRGIDLADVMGDERPEIVCACEDGTVKIVNAEGEVVAWYQAGGWVRHVRACELDGDPATRELVATCDDGTIYGLQVAP